MSASRTLAGLGRLVTQLPAPCSAHVRRQSLLTTSHSLAKLPRASSRVYRITVRPFSTTGTKCHGAIKKPNPGEELSVTFVEKDGQEHKLTVAPGDTLLDIAQAHDLEMEGACGGSVACSTCHVIVDEEWYEKTLPEGESAPDDDEADMLDLAFGLTDTSRLGCQIKMSPELDGLRVRLPPMTRNIQATNFEPQNKASTGD